MKLVNIQNVKHPVSLYIYDTPGNLHDVRETAVIFPAVDIVFIVLNGDEILDENFDESQRIETIELYRDYAIKNIEKYQGKKLKVVKPMEVPIEAVDPGLIPLNSAHEPLVAASRLDLDESAITPLHQQKKSQSEAGEEKEEYPKIVYVFTHRDKIDVKGVRNKEVVNKNIEKLMRGGVISKDYVLVSSKIHTDIHFAFKNEIQLKLNTDMLYMT